MKKYIKYVVLLFLLLSFNLDVEAAEMKCFKLPVGDEQIVIPSNWIGRCVYRNVEGGGDDYDVLSTTAFVFLDFDYGNLEDSVLMQIDTIDRNTIGGNYDEAVDDTLAPFSSLSLHGVGNDFAPLSFEFKNGQSFIEFMKLNTKRIDLNGLWFYGDDTTFYDRNKNSKQFNEFNYSKKIVSGCPEYFGWVLDKYGKVSLIFNNDGSISYSDGSSYAKYQLLKYKYQDTDEFGRERVYDTDIDNADDDTGLIVIDKNSGIYEYTPSKYKIDPNYDPAGKVSLYEIAINECEEVKDSDLDGEEDVVLPGEYVNTSKTCSYYFEYEENNACYKYYVDATYTLEYYKDPIDFKLNFESLTYKVKSSSGGKVILSSADNEIAAIGEIMKNGSNQGYNLGNFIGFDGENLFCPQKQLFIFNPDNKNDMTIFAESEYSSYETIYKTQTFYPSLNGPTGNCENKPTPTPSQGFINWGDPVDKNCNGIIGEGLVKFIKKIFRWIQILAPIFVIIVSSAEFAGSLLQDDKDALKKASNRFMKRLIIAIALFFLPLILSFVFDIFNSVAGRFVDVCI